MSKSNGKSNGNKHPGMANLRYWKPGESGNPKGRKKGQISITKMLQDVLKSTAGNDPQKRKYAALLAESLIVNAIKGNGTAIRQILDRVDGPVATEITGNADKPLVIRQANDSELDRAARELLARINSGAEESGGTGEAGQ